MNHAMNIYVARDYGINEALLLNNIYFWVQHNKANNQNYHDDYHWVYNSAEAFKKLFIYLTKRQIEYALRKLEQNGLIKTGVYNKNKYDRTRWYTTTEKAEIYFKPANEQMLQICRMDATPLSHGNDTNVTPIPDINADKNYIYKPDISCEKKIKKIAAEKKDDEHSERQRRNRELKEYFMENVWERYPIQHRVGEKLCFSKFKSAIKNGSSKEEVMEGFNTYLKVIEIHQHKGTEQFIKRLDNWFAAESWKNPNKLMVSPADKKLQQQINSTQKYCGTPPSFQKTFKKNNVDDIVEKFEREQLERQMQVERLRREFSCEPLGE